MPTPSWKSDDKEPIIEALHKTAHPLGVEKCYEGVNCKLLADARREVESSPWLVSEWQRALRELEELRRSIVPAAPKR